MEGRANLALKSIKDTHTYQKVILSFYFLSGLGQSNPVILREINSFFLIRT